MNRSILTLLEADSANSAREPVVIGFHDYGASEVEGLRLAQSLHPGHHAYAPRGLRYCSPRYLPDSGGYNAFLWYMEQDGVADPASFGDALSQAEATLLDIVERQSGTGGSRPTTVLVGQGQGGALSLVLGAIWPELVESITVIDSMFPRVPGWGIPIGDMTGISVTLLRGEGSPEGHHHAETEAKLRKAGASIFRKTQEDAPSLQT